MIQSMTGYGKATAELSDKKINIEIKSLNSKAMDLSARIAPLYREKEMEIRNEISKMLERGKVDFSLWIEKKDAEQLATPINWWRPITNGLRKFLRLPVFPNLPTGLPRCSVCRM